ncbi:hypothetical protein OUZ56_032660, partial [Daphnia magna]
AGRKHSRDPTVTIGDLPIQVGHVEVVIPGRRCITDPIEAGPAPRVLHAKELELGGRLDGGVEELAVGDRFARLEHRSVRELHLVVEAEGHVPAGAPGAPLRELFGAEHRAGERVEVDVPPEDRRRLIVERLLDADLESAAPFSSVGCG